MEAYKGTVKNIIHTSEDQNFKILILNTDDGELNVKVIFMEFMLDLILRSLAIWK